MKKKFDASSQIAHDFRLCTESQHMFKLICEKPFEAIVIELEDLLCSVVQGTKIQRLSVLQAPHWLLTYKDQNENAPIRRFGFAMQVKLEVSMPEMPSHQVLGIFTWCFCRNDATNNWDYLRWWDLNGTLEEFGQNGELLGRIYRISH